MTIFRIILSVTLLFSGNFAFAQSEAEAQRFLKGMQALNDPIKATAYARFLSLYLITEPHPDAGIQRFVLRARDGDSGAFAFTAFMVWQGYSGFRQDQPSAKLALVKAMRDGSAVAAGFIGETFAQGRASTDEEKVAAYTGALHWYGVAVGMGESQVYEQAKKLIDSLAGTNLDLRRKLMSFYNTGLEDGAGKVRKP